FVVIDRDVVRHLLFGLRFLVQLNDVPLFFRALGGWTLRLFVFGRAVGLGGWLIHVEILEAVAWERCYERNALESMGFLPQRTTVFPMAIIKARSDLFPVSF